MTQEKEAFLDRWSRLKREQPAQVDTPPAAAEAERAPAPPLQPVEELKPESDFTPFMNAQVDPETRRSALKKLFTDAHFNVPDPFEPYSVDLTGEDPIPLEMLKQLDHAKRLLFDEPEKVAEAQAAAQTPAQDAPQTQPLETDLENVAGKQDA